MEKKRERCENTQSSKRSAGQKLRTRAARVTVPALLAGPVAFSHTSSAFALNVEPDLTTLTGTIDSAGASFIGVAQSIAIAVMIVLIITMAFTLWVKKSAESLADMKARLVGLCVSILFVFFPESTIGLFLGLFGAELPAFIFPFWIL